MRTDSCRKCGMEQQEYDGSEKCQSCGKEFAQFVCIKCQIVSEPQYHIHDKTIRKALEIVI